MKLEPKKVKYSSRYGITVEFQRPDAIEISFKDMTALYYLLCSPLTQAQMDEAFSKKEQAVIQKYFNKSWRKFWEIQVNHNEKGTQRQIIPNFKTELASFRTCVYEGIENVMADFWGWKVNNDARMPRFEKEMRDLIAADEALGRKRKWLAESLVRSQLAYDKQKVTPSVKKVLTDYYGDFDWKVLLKEGLKKQKDREERQRQWDEQAKLKD